MHIDWALLAAIVGGVALLALFDLIVLYFLSIRAAMAADAGHRASIRARKSARAAARSAADAAALARTVRLQADLAVIIYRRQVADEARQRALIRAVAAPSTADLFATNRKADANG